MPALVALLSDDLTWSEAEGFPYFSGTWRRPQEVVEKLRILRRGGRNVVAFGAYRGLNRATGRKLMAPFAHRWRVTEGRISSFAQYTDTLLVIRAMAP
jgi:ketosteroid isomerase-like protein